VKTKTKNIEVELCETCWDWFEPGKRSRCSNPKCANKGGGLKRYSIPPERMADLYERTRAGRGLVAQTPLKSLTEFRVKETT